MNMLVPLVLLGWIPFVLALFMMFPPRRAVILAFLIAWMFLPVAGYRLPGLPDYTKMTATCAGVLLATLLFDTGRLFSFRPRWLDLPVAAWCLCPLGSSLSNGLGWYDGFSCVVSQVVIWGLPYLIGRLYFRDAASLRELAVWIFIGGLVYVPLCLFEIRMSPQLHRHVYGFHPHSFAQTMRFGGFRPTVFMGHGLMVGMWMATASLLGVWLWASGSLKRLWGMPMAWLVPVLLVTTLLCKSVGALGLMVLGLGVLFASRRWNTAAPMLCLLMAAPLYVGLRATGRWGGQSLVAVASRVVSPERAESLQFRIRNEDMLAEKALQRPWFGWGGWGRARIFRESDGKDISVTDGYWIIVLGNMGLVGLSALGVVLLMPALLVLGRWPPGRWGEPLVGPAAAVAIIVALYMIDNVLNAMTNPIYTVMIGGIASATRARPVARRPRAVRRAVPHVPEIPGLDVGGETDEMDQVTRPVAGRESQPPSGFVPAGVSAER